MTQDVSAARILVRGRVQGVGFRFYTEEKARQLGLHGWVRNCPDGDVEAYAEGPRLDIEELIRTLHQGPPMARIQDISVDWLTPEGRHSGFSIAP